MRSRTRSARSGAAAARAAARRVVIGHEYVVRIRLAATRARAVAGVVDRARTRVVGPRRIVRAGAGARVVHLDVVSRPRAGVVVAVAAGTGAGAVVAAIVGIVVVTIAVAGP